MKRVDFGHLVMRRLVRTWVVRAELAVAGLACAACSSDSGTTGARSGSGSAASAGASSGFASGGSTGSNATGGSGSFASTGSMQGSGSMALSGSSAGSTTGGTPGSGPDGGFMGSGSDGGATSGTAGGMNEAGLNDAPADASGPFALTSSGFKEGAMIPLAYKCAQGGTPQSTGMNMSPPLSWTAGPAQTKSYAAVLVHVATDMSVHWVLWDIPPGTTSLPAGIPNVPNPPMPAGTSQMKPGVDGSTWFGYQGVCPRPGAGMQRYEYSVYALDVSMLPGVTTQSTGMGVLAAVKAHQLARATLSGTEMY